MTDYAVTGPGFAIAASVLDAIARRAAEAVDGVSVLERRLRRRELSIEVDGAALSAALDVSVRYGVPLPAAADDVRRRVAHALAHATGLEVRSVDVVVAAVV